MARGCFASAARAGRSDESCRRMMREASAMRKKAVRRVRRG
jgi:hypothetical protein